MSYVGFEPTIPASERTKIVHALDRSFAFTTEVNKSNFLDNCDLAFKNDVTYIYHLFRRKKFLFCTHKIE
jgi:hypothetical protein